MSQSSVHLTTRHRNLGHRPPEAGPADGADAEDFTATPSLPPVSRSKQASVLVSSFLAIFMTIGYNQSYGVFQEYYLSSSQTLLKPLPASMPTPPTALLAFVGTLGAGLTWGGSIFVNPLISRIEHAAHASYVASNTSHGPLPARLRLLKYCTSRYITVAGVVCMVAGFVLASYARSITHLLLTQGLLYGVGSSLLYFPLLGPAPEYFTAHRGTALGVILSGAGIGGIVFAPLVRTMLSSIGGAWTLRVIAGIALLIGMPVAWMVPESRFPVVPATAAADSDSASPEAAASAVARPARRRTHISAGLATSPTFLFAAAAAFCQAAGAQLPMTFIPSYTVALGQSSSTGATLLAVANVVNALARIASGYAGDRFGRLNALFISLTGTFAAVFGLWLTSVYSSGDGVRGELAVRLWLAFVILYSLSAGGYYALMPATIADVFGIRSYAAVNGFIYFIRGCGTIVGSPVGGALLRSNGGTSESGKGYEGAVLFDGALLVGSTLFICGVRWTDAMRRGWMWRA